MSNEKENIDLTKLDTTLPSDILNERIEDDDSDMPLPETAEYKDPSKADDNKILVPTAKFYKLFNECLGKLPYASILGQAGQGQIKLIDLFRFIESKTSTGMTVKEMNTIISFIVTAPMEYVRPFMEIVESQQRQQELWVLKA